MIVRDGDLADDRVRALVAEHLAGMYENSPPEAVHALDTSRLQSKDVSLFTVWDGEDLLAMGALKQLDATSGELKSMRTAKAHLRRGAAAFLLEHLIATARARGYRRLSLETGSGPAFAPAIALYRRFGFTDGGPFADYEQNDFCQFLHLDL